MPKRSTHPPKAVRSRSTPIDPALRVAELEIELSTTRRELQGAIRALEVAGEEHKAIGEKTQSVNEELVALNGRIRKTLERQRTTSNDLQNVLYSTDVATLFLDTNLNIRFFTPAAKLLFGLVPDDIGRPLVGLIALAADGALTADMRVVLGNFVPIEREIEGRDGLWYVRRILPYRAQDNAVEGVVISFADITQRRQIADVLAAANREVQIASVAKSRFLAAASHDLRQPLQTLTLLQGLLAKQVEGEAGQKLVARIDDTLNSMSGMLNALLDINQIEAGMIRAEIGTFQIGDLLEKMRAEFGYLARERRLDFRVVPCALSVRSDSRLLEQMLRNLLSNAFKYTSRGKVLLGCRRRGGILKVEVWDTGIGIPEDEHVAIFEEYHQLDNPARERSRGLGLGLSIVKRLGTLLAHPVRVRSRVGRGSGFAIDVACPQSVARADAMRAHAAEIATSSHKAGTILVVEDDPDVCELLERFLVGEGHRTMTAPDGAAALALIARSEARPDLLLADFNLPNGQNGLQLAMRLRALLARELPAIILTGDISTDTLRDVARQGCLQLNKPVKLKDLTRAIERLLPKGIPAVAAAATRPPVALPLTASTAVVFVVDDDRGVLAAISSVLEEGGYAVEGFESGEAFVRKYRSGRDACLLVDAYLPGMSGLDLLQWVQRAGHRLPAIMITGNSDVSTAVRAMKAGAIDFIEKPIAGPELLACVRRSLDQSRDTSKLTVWQQDAAGLVATLTVRERQIMEKVVAGDPSKNIAADLGIHQRTVENHRAAIMKKTGSKSLPALARLALAAARSVPGDLAV